MPSRDEIRLRFEAVIGGVFAGSVTSDRFYDSRDTVNFAKIYIEAVDMASDGLVQHSSATINVLIGMAGAADSDLDLQEQVITAALFSDSQLRSMLSGAELSRVEYVGGGESPYPQLLVQYEITY
jgi:purine-nucleoside phosphorylase